MNIVISGTTNGIGLATLKALCPGGHNIITLNRNSEAADSAASLLWNLAGPGCRLQNITADYSDLNSVAEAAEAVTGRFSVIDLLINNAGTFNDVHRISGQGLEMTIAVNYAATVLLTMNLLPLLKKAGRGRILTLSSRAALYGKIRPKSFFSSGHPHGFRAYSASKLALTIWNRDSALRYPGLDFVAVHPGEVASNIWTGKSLVMKLTAPVVRKRAQSPEEGARTTVHLAGVADLSRFSGLMIENKDQIVGYSSRCVDDEAAGWLRRETEEIFRQKGLI